MALPGIQLFGLTDAEVEGISECIVGEEIQLTLRCKIVRVTQTEDTDTADIEVISGVRLDKQKMNKRERKFKRFQQSLMARTANGIMMPVERAKGGMKEVGGT